MSPGCDFYTVLINTLSMAANVVMAGGAIWAAKYAFKTFQAQSDQLDLAHEQAGKARDQWERERRRLGPRFIGSDLYEFKELSVESLGTIYTNEDVVITGSKVQGIATALANFINGQTAWNLFVLLHDENQAGVKSVAARCLSHDIKLGCFRVDTVDRNTEPDLWLLRVPWEQRFDFLEMEVHIETAAGYVDLQRYRLVIEHTTPEMTVPHRACVRRLDPTGVIGDS
jgi:hypothetical protein